MDVVPRFLALFAAALVLLFVGTGPADAHASLVSTSPADGSRISTAPATVELTFSEDVGSGFVAVTAPDGTKLKTSRAHISGAQVHADLAASDQRGRYTVAYRVVSADGHPVSGAFTFTTTSGRAVTQQEAPPTEPFVDRHGGTILVLALAVAVLAIGVILLPLTRQRRP
jgi:methionine-rich copper-binding protein CopC